MIYIAHRGNITDSNPSKENCPDYITSAIDQGYDAEIDVWYIEKDFFLGHDKPVCLIQPEFLMNEKIWCHAKNKNALIQLKNLGVHFFWHNTDDYTLTSKGFIWTYPGKPLTTESIAVLPETLKNKVCDEWTAIKTQYSIDELKPVKGICSDIIEHYKKLLK
jgi:hypothetical protein